MPTFCARNAVFIVKIDNNYSATAGCALDDMRHAQTAAHEMRSLLPKLTISTLPLLQAVHLMI